MRVSPAQHRLFLDKQSAHQGIVSVNKHALQLVLADSPLKTVSTASTKSIDLRTVELVVRVFWLVKMVVDLEFKLWGMLNK